ncbi:E3 ubiquitin-protein ligase rnf8-like isoform X2 [Varroa jacobsoni]|uniref:E3 ubiquitin-protein ligase CHFR n=1 Tax=Varroa destructor TaxID=109461 RepID=A0A7M7KQH8_VARDE|nr:E3 ubiquitin-protein ligase rnf8-like [Varroa destructor]XP_022687390.1 E3 ubiquitin-protein ligase rnf8-like isoform X2 [Varroa jacobsoni]
MMAASAAETANCLMMRAEPTREIPLKLDEEILGRSGNCSVSIHSVIVSRRHAEFRRSKGGSWTVRDLASVNGVYVNHRKIEPPACANLKSEDVISLGPIHRTNMAFQFVQIPDDEDAKLVSLNTVFWLSTAANKVIYTPAGAGPHGKSCSGSSHSARQLKEQPIPESNNEENDEEPHTEKVGCLPAASSGSSSRCSTGDHHGASQHGAAHLHCTAGGDPGCVGGSAICAVSGAIGGAHSSIQTDVVKRVENIMEEELTCSICSELFISAVTLSCGHNFCQMCIRSWRRKKDACPICSAPIGQEIRAYVLDSVIKQLVSLNPPLKKHYEQRYKRFA